MAAIESPLKERITPERLLDLRGVLDDLMRAKVVSQRDAEDILIAPRTAKQMHMHPLEIIAERELDDPRRPGKKLDLDELTHWLCEVSHQPYHRIDPLKVNVNKTTEVMSYAFAQRHNILAVEVTAKRKSSLPARSRSWRRGKASGSDAARPAHHPGRDQSARTHAVHARVLHDGALGAQGIRRGISKYRTSPISSRLLELGQLKVARRQRRAHRQHRRLAAAVRVRPARQRHPHRTAPRVGHVRFRIDGVLHNVYELPPQVTHGGDRAASRSSAG